MTQTHVVGISDYQVAKTTDVLVTYALGSCVGICLFDSGMQIGGLAHIMLPSSRQSNRSEEIRKFADTAIPAMLERVVAIGGRRRLIQAKIAGGAQMFATAGDSCIANIGQRNIVAVKDCLKMLHIPIVAEDIGKNYGRTVLFYPETCLMVVRSASRGEWIW